MSVVSLHFGFMCFYSLQKLVKYAKNQISVFSQITVETVSCL